MTTSAHPRGWARRTALFLLLSIGAPVTALATEWKDIRVQDVRPPSAGASPVLELGGENVHNVGSIQLHVSNFGLLGSLPGTNYPYSGAPSAQWPPGSGTEYIFGGGLWVGAIQSGMERVSGLIHSHDRMSFEFRPGTGAHERIYRAYESMPGGARLPSASADDDGDGAFDEDPLDGHDDDGDGRTDEDFAAISTQMFSCSYRDDDPAIRFAEPDHVPLGIHVTQSTLAWDSDEARDFIGLEFVITNAGTAPMESVYVGLYVDFDVGQRDRSGVAQDDLVGFWEGKRRAPPSRSPRNVKVSMGYAWDADTDEGQAPGWMGIAFLGAVEPHDLGIVRPVRLRNFRMFSGTANFFQGGDPTMDYERYLLLAGQGPRPLAPPESLDVRPPLRARYPGDYRTLLSCGPFGNLEPGESLRIAAALVVAPSFDALVDRAVAAQLTYDGSWLDCDGDPRTGIDGRERARCLPEAARQCILHSACDPVCPADCSNRSCASHAREDECVWQNADCDLEEELEILTGVDGRECQVQWLGASFPPVPPAMRVVPYEDHVEIYWDDRSERIADLQHGVNDFESYAVWRADGWTRPLGTSAQTGPPAHLWSMLGEFDVRNGVGADTGVDALAYTPNIPSELVDFYRRWWEEHPGETPPDPQGHTRGECDTAQALARGTRFHRFVDPPFVHGVPDGGPCPPSGRCAPVRVDGQLRPARCDEHGRCRATMPAPHPGTHLFYAVTASDHALADFGGGLLVPTGPGIAGHPSGNFAYVSPPTAALAPERAADAEHEIYAVPNPVTRESLAPWQLQPNNDDPTGIKVEFHHLPQSPGVLTIWTLAGDRVRELRFDGSTGDGTVAWDLVSRNGQDVTSGVYLYTVEAQDPAFHRFVGKLVIVR